MAICILDMMQRDSGVQPARPASQTLTDNLGDVVGTSAHGEGPQLDVRLHSGVLELTANQTLGIEHCGSRQSAAAGFG